MSTITQSLNRLRSKIRTSIHGRRFGLTHTNLLAGHRGQIIPVTAATSDTTGTEIPNSGIASVESTTNDSFSLQAPEEGCEVTLMSISTSTGVRTVTPASGSIVSTNGVAGASLAINGLGDRITLVGLSTSQYGVKQNNTVAVSS